MAYATDLDLSQRYPSLDCQSITERDAELDASSEWIDSFCHRTFALEESVTVRYFAAKDRSVLDLGGFEIGTNDSVVVATDDGSGDFATTVSVSAYQLEPVNAPYASPAARPYTQIRSLGGSWPVAYVDNARQERVRVTARYGWPAVPASVKRACLDLTANSFENSGGVKAESIDGYSVTYTTADGRELAVPATVLSRLQPFVRGWVA